MTHTTQAGLRARCLNCGADLSVVRFVACCRDPQPDLNLSTPPAPQETAPAAEPVAWLHRFNGGDWDAIVQGATRPSCPAYVEQRPLYASPPPSAAPTDNTALVSDDMIERACRVHNVGWSKWHEPQKKTAREVMKAALCAALASRPAATTDNTALAEALRYMVNHAEQMERKEGIYWEATNLARAALASRPAAPVADPGVAAALREIKAQHDKAATVHRGKVWQDTAGAIGDAIRLFDKLDRAALTDPANNRSAGEDGA